MSSVHVQKFSLNTWTKKTLNKKWPVIDNQSKTTTTKANKDGIVNQNAGNTANTGGYRNADLHSNISKNSSSNVPSNRSKEKTNNAEIFGIHENKVQPLASSTPNKPPAGAHASLEQKDTKIPKLVKSKTCSIIESKCILKKSVSQPLCDDSHKIELHEKEDIKTKSLNNLDKTFSDNDLKILTSPKIKKLNSNFAQIVNIKPEEDTKVQPKCSQAKMQSNVKEIVRRLNSLTELTPANESDLCNQESPKQIISKAKSTLDLSSNKKLSYSKIPVNTILRKTYPSIPCDLNNLDSDKSSAVTRKQSNLNGKFTKSAHNLTVVSTPKYSLQKNDKIKTKSSLNLNGSNSKLSLPKSDSNLGKSMQNLNLLTNKKNLIHKSAQNLTKSFQFEISRNTTNVQTNKVLNTNKANVQKRDFVNQDITTSKLVKNLSQNFNGMHEKTSATKQNAKIQIQTGNTLKKDGFRTKPVTSKTEKITVNATNNFKFKIKNESLKPVIQLAEDFNKPCGKPKLLKTEPIKSFTKKEKELKTSGNECKPSIKTKEDGNVKKIKPELVKVDLKTARKCLNKINTENKSNYSVDVTDHSQSKVEKLANKQDIGQNKILNANELNKKNFDYNSDNSDDSGNISNELELDDSRLSSSSESLSTVLDVSVTGQDSGVDLSKIQHSPENGNKVRFYRIQ